MKYYLYMILFLAGFCNCFEDNVKSERYMLEKVWEHDEDLNLNLVGLKENDREIIYRPCNLRDLDCIRNFFAKNSKCSISKGPAPDPLILKIGTIFLPHVNLTVVLENLQISGLNNAEMRDFYVNNDTGNVVFAVEIRGQSERSTDTTFIYKRTGKEPIVLTDYSTITHGLITYTAVIPKVPDLQLDKADIHADIDDVNPSYVIGPKAYNSTDPNVQNAFNTLSATLAISLREVIVLKASIFTSVFIQYNICDFGLPLISI